MSVGPYKQPIDSSLVANGAAQDVLAYNGKRLSASILNQGAVTVWIAFGADAVLNKGKAIPAGCIGLINIETDADTWMADTVSVITDGTNCDLAISEVTK